MRVFVSSPKQRLHVSSESKLSTQGVAGEWCLEIAGGGQLRSIGRSLRVDDPGERKQMF